MIENRKHRTAGRGRKLTGRRSGLRPSKHADPAKKTSPPWRPAALRLLAALTFCISALPAFGQPPQQLIYMTRKGLDPAHNRIDRLINTYGFLCVPDPARPRPPCRRIESELVSILGEVPPTRAGIGRKLTALGAVCEISDRLLRCTYKREVENAGWLNGASAPQVVLDELFEVDFRAVGVDGALQLEAKFNRTSKRREAAE